MVPPPSPTTLQKRLEYSMASSLDLASIRAKPTMASLASAKGPSVTVILPPAFLIRVGLGDSPPVASNTPARVISSISLPISAYISGVGGAAGVLGSLLVIIKNLILGLLGFRVW